MISKIQTDILKIISGENQLTLRDMAEEVGTTFQNISYHLNQLEKKGYLRKDLDTNTFVVSKPHENPYGIVMLPLISSTVAQCGPDVDIFNPEYIKENIPIPSKYLGISNSNDYFILKASGKSMEPKIISNDLVICKKNCNLENGQIYAVIHEGKLMIKLLQTNSNQLFLTSINTQFTPILLDKNDEIRIAGKVVGIISRSVNH